MLLYKIEHFIPTLNLIFSNIQLVEDQGNGKSASTQFF